MIGVQSLLEVCPCFPISWRGFSIFVVRFHQISVVFLILCHITIINVWLSSVCFDCGKIITVVVSSVSSASRSFSTNGPPESTNLGYNWGERASSHRTARGSPSSDRWSWSFSRGLINIDVHVRWCLKDICICASSCELNSHLGNRLQVIVGRNLNLEEFLGVVSSES